MTHERATRHVTLTWGDRPQTAPLPPSLSLPSPPPPFLPSSLPPSLPLSLSLRPPLPLPLPLPLPPSSPSLSLPCPSPQTAAQSAAAPRARGRVGRSLTMARSAPAARTGGPAQPLLAITRTRSDDSEPRAGQGAVRPLRAPAGVRRRPAAAGRAARIGFLDRQGPDVGGGPALNGLAVIGRGLMDVGRHRDPRVLDREGESEMYRWIEARQREPSLGR